MHKIKNDLTMVELLEKFLLEVERVELFRALAEAYAKIGDMEKAKELLWKAHSIINLWDDDEKRSLGKGMLAITAAKIGLLNDAMSFISAVMHHQKDILIGGYSHIFSALLKMDDTGTIENVLANMADDVKASLLARLSLIAWNSKKEYVDLYFERAIEECVRFRKFRELCNLSPIFAEKGMIDEYIRIMKKAPCFERGYFVELFENISEEKIVHVMQKIKELLKCENSTLTSQNFLALAKVLLKRERITLAKELEKDITSEYLREHFRALLAIHLKDIADALKIAEELSSPEEKINLYKGLLSRRFDKQIFEEFVKFVKSIPYEKTRAHGFAQIIAILMSINQYQKAKKYLNKILKFVRILDSEDKEIVIKLMLLSGDEKKLIKVAIEMGELPPCACKEICKFFLKKYTTRETILILRKIPRFYQFIPMLPEAIVDTYLTKANKVLQGLSKRD